MFFFQILSQAGLAAVELWLLIWKGNLLKIFFEDDEIIA